jgi:TatD DNase family protein
MQFNYFDIHSHINLKPLYEQHADILASMKEKGIGTITVGVDYETSKLAIDLAEENPELLWATIGLHPNDNIDEIFDYEKYLELARHEKVIAIGECGLDYFRDQSEETKIRQKEIFKKQIEIAIEVGKPLMLHCRPSKGSMDAYEEALNILETYTVICNFHFFVGNVTIAKRIVDHGWTMSFDGPITFSSDYDEVIRSAPVENIMAETDAPFAAPIPYRGKTCEPWMVIEVIKKIAEIKGMNEEVCREAMLSNAKRVFGIHEL